MGGFLGIGGKKKEEPVVQAPVAPLPVETDPTKKRIGRAQLISTSSRGVLGNANTTGKKLSV